MHASTRGLIDARENLAFAFPLQAITGTQTHGYGGHAFYFLPNYAIHYIFQHNILVYTAPSWYSNHE
jgi:hypothetical protein